MSDLQATKFKQSKSLKYSKKLFITIIEYAVFCYAKLEEQAIDEKTTVPPYSRDYCKKHTKFKFEDYLKREFVNNYLQEQKRNFGNLLIERVDFQYETEKDYSINGIKASDKIDIFISSLGLQTHWSEIKREDIYFVFECKILKNTANNNSYIGDIQKFVERKYDFRFPFEGMIGFVEKSNRVSIDAIIVDINVRLREHSNIVTIQELTYFSINEWFKYCRYSKHIKSNLPLEIYHLFFDYSRLIID